MINYKRVELLQSIIKKAFKLCSEFKYMTSPEMISKLVTEQIKIRLFDQKIFTP